MKNKVAASAAKATASIFCILAGLGGLNHGIGEVLQGNVKPEGLFINSWTQGPIATHMGGEPGMTIVPNLLITGMLTILVSLAVLVWAAWFVGRKNGGWILILLSVAMLLFGGGVGPPIIGILAGVAGTGIGAPLTGWRSRLPARVRRFLATLWPWVFGLGVASGVLLVVGSVILVYLFDVNQPDLFLNTFFLTVVSLLLTVLTCVAYDVQKHQPGIAFRH